MKKVSLFFLLIFLLIACEKTPLPKPHGQLRLEYPEAKYDLFKSNCGFDFEHSIFAELREKKYPCWYDLFYPSLNATIYLSYHPLQDNFEILMKDAEERVYKHAIRASFIKERSFSHPEKKVYGKLYELGGQSASNAQFVLTDSTKHFLSGALYFYTKPNEDSLRPAINYIQRDIEHLMQTLYWK